MKPTQRFIAGATCPKCHAMDSLLVDSTDQGIECVDCGHRQSAQERDQNSQSLKDPGRKTTKVPDSVSVSDIIRINNLKD